MPKPNEQSARAVPEPARVWLWFRMSLKARSPVEKDFFALPKPAYIELRATMKRYALGLSRRHDVDHLGDGIYEIRTRLGNNHYRVLFFVWGSKLVALSAFYKNQRATPKSDIDTARSRRTAWRLAFGDERIAPPP